MTDEEAKLKSLIIVLRWDCLSWREPMWRSLQGVPDRDVQAPAFIDYASAALRLSHQVEPTRPWPRFSSQSDEETQATFWQSFIAYIKFIFCIGND